MQWSSCCWTRGELAPSTPRSQKLTQRGPILLLAPQRALNRMDHELYMFAIKSEIMHFLQWTWSTSFLFAACSGEHTHLLLQKTLWRRGWTAPLPCCCRLPLSLQTGTGVRCCRFCKYISMHQAMPALSGSRCCCQVGGKPRHSQSPLRSVVPLELAEIGTKKLRLWPKQLGAEI